MDKQGKTNEEQIKTVLQNQKKLIGFASKSNGTTGRLFTGFILGFNNPESGTAVLVEVDNKEKTDKVVVLAEITTAVLANSDLANMKVGDEVNFEGVIVQQMMMKDEPWVTFIALTMERTGAVVVGLKPQNFDFTTSNILETYANRAKGTIRTESEELQPLIDSIIADMRIVNPKIKGVLTFCVKNNGEVIMLAKGDMYAKEVKKIGNMLLEFTKKQNPDYIWHAV